MTDAFTHYTLWITCVGLRHMLYKLLLLLLLVLLCTLNATFCDTSPHLGDVPCHLGAVDVGDDKGQRLKGQDDEVHHGVGIRGVTQREEVGRRRDRGAVRVRLFEDGDELAVQL